MLFNSNPATKKIFYYFSFLMVVVYLSLGLLFLFTDIAIDLFPNYRIQLGAVMSGYAIFRAYTTYKKYKSESQD